MTHTPVSPALHSTIVDLLRDNNGSIKAVQSHLADRGLPIPPRSTIWSIRRHLPLPTPGRPAPTAQYHASKLREANSEIATLRVELGRILSFQDQLRDAIVATPPAPRIYRPRPAPATESEIAAVLLLSDWHIGETITLEDTAGLNSYSHSIAQSRLDYLSHKFLGWITTLRHGYHINDLHLLLLGDFISGDIHDELRTTAEFPVPVQVVRAAQLLSRLTASLSPHFARIHLHCVEPDNHGRLTKKLQYKLRGNTYNYVIYELLDSYLSNHPHIIYHRYPSASAVASIHHNHILLDHGHNVKSWMGIPYYGMERDEGRAARLHMRQSTPYNLHVRGHWHYAALGPFGIINGSLSGPSELDLSYNRDASPTQVSFLLHPTHGFFNWTAWNLYPATAPRPAPRRRPRS